MKVTRRCVAGCLPAASKAVLESLPEAKQDLVLQDLVLQNLVLQDSVLNEAAELNARS